ncbi:MAG: transposase [Spirochaetes bacterium]|nr:transposase [Spirochaetota bacterium]MBN2771294.1 transposase [Spirochaetota bacterium]
MTYIDLARVFGKSKHTVYRLDKTGISHELLEQEGFFPETICVDEISRKKEHVYATIVTAPGVRRVLDVIKGRKKETLEGFFRNKKGEMV